MKIGRRKRTTIVRPNSRRKLVPWRNPHAPPAQAPVNVPAVMESDFLLMKTLPPRNHRGQVAHVPAVAAAVNVPPVKVVDSRALLLPRPNPLPGPAAGPPAHGCRIMVLPREGV